MKKRCAMLLMAGLMCLSLLTPYSGMKVSAMTVLETDVTTASDGCKMLGVYGTYYSEAQEALNRINEIRKEACDAGNVPDPRNSSRMLSPSDYVPIKWSTDLESIARIRAMEGGLAFGFLGSGHSRLNGKSCWEIKYNGVSSWAEVLAYNWDNSMVAGINQWYDEKSDWVNKVSGAVTGHYTSMIDPSNTYVGIGDFYTEEAQYPNTVAGQFSSSSQNLNQIMQVAQADVIQKIEVKDSYITGYVLDGTDTIYTDKTTTLTPKANLKNGSQTLKLWVLDSVTYTSSEPAVATVTDTGVVTGLKNGTTTITAKIGAEVLATTVITVKCDHAKELISETVPTCTATGLKIYSCETCGGSTEQEVPKIAHDYIYGEADTEGYRTGTCSVCGDKVKIIPPTNMTLWWRNDTSDSIYYWQSFPSSNPVGSTVYCWINNVDGDSNYRDMVIESTDESVISIPETVLANSADNQLKVLAPGITTLTIYPKYNPNLKKQVIARIGDAGSVDITTATVSLSQTSYEYSGEACTPSVSVSYHDTDLQQGIDYTVAYENNKEAGIATAVITGNGIFAGTIQKNYTIEEPQHIHNYGEWEITTAASCSIQGEKRRKCTLCDDYETEVIDKLEHVIATTEAVPATCTENGSTAGTYCSVCESVIVAPSMVEATGHNYVDGQCLNCNDILYVVIDGLKYTILADELHSVSVAAQAEATLTGEVNIPSGIVIGDRKYKVTTIESNAFTGQDKIVTITIPKTVTTIENKAFSQCSSLINVIFYGLTAPVTAEDIFMYTSSVEIIIPSGATGYDILEAKLGVSMKEEHIHNMVYYETVDAGCEQTGNIAYYVCGDCDKIYTDEFGKNEITLEDTLIESTGHAWNGEYTVDVPATATTDGLKSIHCNRCSMTKNETVIPALGEENDNEGDSTDDKVSDEEDDTTESGKDDATQGGIDSIGKDDAAQEGTDGTGKDDAAQEGTDGIGKDDAAQEGTDGIGKDDAAQEGTDGTGKDDAAQEGTDGNRKDDANQSTTEADKSEDEKQDTTEAGANNVTQNSGADNGTGGGSHNPGTGTGINNVTYNSYIVTGTNNVATTEVSQAVNNEKAEIGKTYIYKKLQYKITGAETVAFVGVADKKLKKVNIPDIVTILGDKFYVTKIEKKACYKNSQIISVSIDDYVSEIGVQAFAKCTKLKTIEIGKGLKNIGNKAFYGAKSLKKMSIKSTKLKKMGAASFRGTSDNLKFSVPTKLMKKYKKLINDAK